MAVNHNLTAEAGAYAGACGGWGHRRRVQSLTATVAVLLGSAAPLAAHAQSVGSPGAGLGMPGAGAPSFGGAAGGKPLNIGIRERTTYDTDAARGNDQAAIIRGLRKDDIIYSPAITVDYTSPSAVRGFALAATVGYDYHQRNSSLSRESINVSGLAHAALGACETTADVSYLRAQSGLEDQTLLVTKNTLQTVSVAGGESCATPGGLMESVSVNYSTVTNSDALLLGSHNVGVSGTVGYRNSVIGQLGLVVSYSKVTYDNVPPLAALDTPSGFHVVSAGLQLTRPIGARLTGTAGFFYSTSTIDNPPALLVGQKQTFDGFTARVGLSYRVGPRLALRGSYARIFQPSVRTGASYAINNLVNLNADYTLSSRIRVYLGGNWSRETYQGQDVNLPRVSPNQVDLKTATVGASFKLGRNSSVAADYQHQESRADLALFNYKAERASLTLATSF